VRIFLASTCMRWIVGDVEGSGYTDLPERVKIWRDRRLQRRRILFGT
jgi:hypothetical protein